VRSAALRYAALAGCLLTTTYAILATLTATGLALLPAKVVIETVLVTVTYLAQRHLVFGRARRPATAGRRRRVCQTSSSRAVRHAPGRQPEDAHDP
jgi:hypothetical protein